MAVFSYAVGLFLMIGSDAQKYFILENKKGLISSGFFGRTRNPNYLGEILIYFSFGVVCESTAAWIMLGTIWVVAFWTRMVAKDVSLKRRKEFQEYEKHSYLLFPKLFEENLLNAGFYAAVFVVCFATWLI